MLYSPFEAARRLGRDDRGTSLVEFGLLAPILGLFLAGSIDLGRGISERYSLQQAAHRAVELLTTRQLTMNMETNEVDFAFLKTEAAAAAGVDVAQVAITRWVECNGELQPEFDDVCQPDEKVARYVQLEINATFDPTFKLAKIYPNANADGTVPMKVEAAVRYQ